MVRALRHAREIRGDQGSSGEIRGDQGRSGEVPHMVRALRHARGAETAIGEPISCRCSTARGR